MRQATGLVTRFLQISGVAAGLLALAACAPPPKPETRTGAAPAVRSEPARPAPGIAAPVDPNRPVLVALLLPHSAADARLTAAAADIEAAARMAQIDARDPLMTLRVYDTQGDPAAAAGAARAALSDGAALILGPLAGASAAAVGPVAETAGINVIAFTNDADVAGGNVWALGPLPGDEIRRVLAYAVAEGRAPIGLAYPENRYGGLMADAAMAEAAAQGVTLRPILPYERSFKGIEEAAKAGADAMTAEIVAQYGRGAVKPAHYDDDAPWRPEVDVNAAFLIPDVGDGLRSMAAFLRYHDMRSDQVRFLGASRWDDPKNVTDSSLENGWFAAADPVAGQAFAERFEASLERRPSPLAMLGYDAAAMAARMLADARRTGDTAPFSAGSITRAEGFDGAVGPVALTPEGRNRRPLAVLKVTPEGMQVLDPAPLFLPGA